MQVAVISDVHANFPALEAVLEEIDASGMDEIWCLGDLVGYGADPARCIEIVRRARRRLPGREPRPGRDRRDRHRRVRATTRATAARVDDATVSPGGMRRLASSQPGGERAGVRAVPRQHPRPGVGVRDRHRTAAVCLELQCSQLEPGRPQPRAARCTGYTGGEFVGGLAARRHRARTRGGPFLLNPGSVGQPRDGDPRAGYLLLDARSGHGHAGCGSSTTSRAAQAAIRDAGLPLRLAARLAEGR